MSLKHIILDPGHGGTSNKDKFRQGPTGEREEWVNLRVCKALKQKLEGKGFVATLTRRTDVEVEHSVRAELAQTSNADLFVSVHHASCDPVDTTLNFPFVYIHQGLNNKEKSRLANQFKLSLSKVGRGEALIFSDQWVFDEGLFVLRELDKLNIPAILTEFSFFSHPEEEQKLKSIDYCEVEAGILAEAIELYFSGTKYFNVKPASFPVAYRTQLNVIKKTLLEENPRSNWTNFKKQAHLHLADRDYQTALTFFEKSLAMNPYHPDIISLLEEMYVCAENIGATEYAANIDSLLEHIW